MIKSIDYNGLGLSVITGSLIYCLGGLDKAIIGLIIFMILDYITGLAKAIKKNNLNSRVMKIGGINKMGTMIVIVIASQVDIIFGIPANGLSLRFLTICYYLGNEGLSILENLALLGIPISPRIKNILQQCKEIEKKEKR